MRYHEIICEGTPTDAFLRWFGSSKVVDKTGKPLKVYHGSGNLPTQFSAEERPDRHGKSHRAVAFFTDNPKVASAYASSRAAYRTQRIDPKRGVTYGGESVAPVYLRIENPFIVDAQGKNWDRLPIDGIIDREPGHKGRTPRPSINQVADYAFEKGYDGVIVHNVNDNAPLSNVLATTYVVFASSQIKSIFAREFDPSSDHINETRRYDEIINEAYNKAALQAEVKTLCDTLEAKFPGLELWCSVGPSGDLGLSQIVVPKQDRSKGTGSAVLQALTDFADRHGIPMTLTPDSSYGGSVTRLRVFYRRFGFRPNIGGRKDFRFSGTMLRRPQA